MRVSLAAVAGLLIAACGSPAAHAGEDELMLDAPEVEIDGAAAGNWYLRADLGYGVVVDGGSPDATSEAGERLRFDEARFSKPFSGGIGIGHRFTDIFRADLAAEFSGGDFDGSARGAAPCAATEASGTSCRHGYSSRYWSSGLMANLYADVGTVMGFTPYLGAGIGATRLQWDDVSDHASCVAGAQTCLQDDYGTSTSDGKDSWRFTYALMAGASYDLGDRVKLDIGYRFSDTGGGEMFGSSGASGRDDGLQRHEIRVGVRAAIW